MKDYSHLGWEAMHSGTIYQLFEGNYCLHFQGGSESTRSSKEIGSSSSGIQSIKSQEAVLLAVIVSEQEI